jgi:hypothetical protein
MQRWAYSKGKAMASDRNTTSRTSAGEGRASAETARLDEAQSVKDKSTNNSAQPSAGRTGKLGARAERPAENRARKTSDAAEPARGGKAPSPAAKDCGAGQDDLPQATRDAAA